MTQTTTPLRRMGPLAAGALLVLLAAGAAAADPCGGSEPAAACDALPRAGGPSKAPPRQRTESTAVSSKISGNVSRAMSAVRARAAAGEARGPAQGSGTPLVRVRPSGAIQIVVVLDEHRPERVADLAAAGLQIEHVLAEQRLVQGWATPDAIEALAALPFVRRVRAPGYPQREGVGSRNTAGDGLLRAAEARGAFGVTGAGVKVGIISDGVDQLAVSVAGGELPGGVEVLKSSGGNEGTAMAEIVKDIAPGAAIAFYGPDTDVDMAVGINALRDAGARVIVDDLTFFAQAKFEDDVIAQTQRAFATAGRVYVTAAANRAQQHYRSAYRRLPGPFLGNWAGAHDYGGGDMGNTLVVPPSCTLFVNLHWNNAKGRAADDLDLFLIQESNQTVLDASLEFQTGVDDAFEALAFTNTTVGAVQVFIAVLEFALVSPPDSLVLDYFASLDCGTSDPGLQYVVAADSVPGNHAVEETVVVAAINAGDPGADSVAAYSSQGPATVAFPVPAARRVPNVSGTDCVLTGAVGFSTFCGTSAAAPHLAGIAALVIERNPALGSTQLHGLLTGTAVDVGTPGYDFAAGFGRADAFHAVDGAAPGGPELFAAVLPGGRAVAPLTEATAFLTILNAGAATASGVRVLPGLPLPATLTVTETNPVTNAPVGAANAPVDIPGGGVKTFVVGMIPQAEMAPTDALFNFVGANSGPAPTLVGVNSLLLSSAHGVPDVVALAATPGGDGIVRVPGIGGTAAFSVATANVGASGAVVVTVDTGTASLPVGVFVCETHPVTGVCLSALAPAVSTVINSGQTPTFAVFVVASAPFAFDPALNRVFVRFRDGTTAIRGATSVALQLL